jgi:hypothetical protein
MKLIHWITITIIFLASVSCFAGRLYTWTDAQGVTHITETPPPPNAQTQDVLDYRQRTDAELKAIEDEKRAFKKQMENKAANQKAVNARNRAREADQQAAEAEFAADAARQRADEFTKQASTNWRRYQRNKATVLRLEAEAQSAQQKADNAKDAAQSTADQAAKAQKRANKTRNLNSTTAADPIVMPAKK